MTAAKAKGTKWETDLAVTLRRFFGVADSPTAPPVYGLAPRRVVQEGFNDTGDLHGIEPYVGQAKDWRAWQDAIREGLDGAQVQAARAGQPYGVAFVKRVRRSVGDGYAVQTVATWARTLLRLRRAETYLADADPGLYAEHVALTEAEASAPFPRP